MFWSIFRIVLGGTIGGLVFAFLSAAAAAEAADSSKAGVVITPLAIVIGIWFFISGYRGLAYVGWGCVGLIFGVIIAVILGALILNISFIVSIAFGVSIGALIGWKKLYIP